MCLKVAFGVNPFTLLSFPPSSQEPCLAVLSAHPDSKRTKITSPETSLSKAEISGLAHTVVYKHTYTHVHTTPTDICQKDIGAS